MVPISVTACTTSLRRWRVSVVPAQPFGHIVVKELFCPEHTSEGLSLYQPLVIAERRRLDSGIECISLSDTRSKKLIETVEHILFFTVDSHKAQSDSNGRTGRNFVLVMH